jgi:hypothetical protein
LVPGSGTFSRWESVRSHGAFGCWASHVSVWVPCSPLFGLSPLDFLTFVLLITSGSQYFSSVHLAYCFWSSQRSLHGN